MRGFLFAFMFALAACEAGTSDHDAQAEELAKFERWVKEAKEKQAALTAPATDAQREIFGPLADLPGQRFRGVPTDGSSERQDDFQHWQWALGGTAILIRHALEDGSYGGDTYVYKDSESENLVYVYITNAGFRTEGLIRINEGGSFAAEEDVAGHPSITKVRSTSTFGDDGKIYMTSEYLDGGNWVTGHSFTYEQTIQDLPVLIAK